MIAMVLGALWQWHWTRSRHRKEIEAVRRELEAVRAELTRVRGATAAVLENLGAKIVDGRLEPNEQQKFVGEARKEAAVLAEFLSAERLLLARLDPDPPAGGILK